MRFVLFILLIHAIGVSAQKHQEKQGLLFHTFKGPEQQELSNIFCIRKDPVGHLWVGSNLGKTYRYTPSLLEEFGAARLATKQFGNSRSTSLFYTDRKGRFWIGSNDGALYRYDTLRNRLILVNDSLRSTRQMLYSVAEQDDGALWLGSMGGGLSLFHPDKGTYRSYQPVQGDSSSLPDRYITALQIDRQGRLWVATTVALCLYNPANDGFYLFRLNNADTSDKYRYRVLRSISMDQRGHFWIGSYNGLHHFDPTTGQSRHIRAYPGIEDSLQQASIYKVVADRHDRLWIATYGGGLQCLDMKTGRFSQWMPEPGNPWSIGSANLFHLWLEEDKNQLWLGFADHSFQVVDLSRPSFSFRHIADFTGDEKDLFRKISRVGKEVMAMGIEGKGLGIHHAPSGQWKLMSVKTQPPWRLPGDKVFRMLPDPAQTDILWLAIEGQGLSKVSYSKGLLKHFSHSFDKKELSNTAIANLAFDPDGRLWILHFRSGLNVLDTLTGTIEWYKPPDLQVSTGVSFETVEEMFPLGRWLWFNTDLGPLVFDTKTRKGKIQNFKGLDFPQKRLRITGYFGDTLLLLAGSLPYKCFLDASGQWLASRIPIEANEETPLSCVLDYQNRWWLLYSDHLELWQNDRKLRFNKEDGLPAPPYLQLLVHGRQLQLYTRTHQTVFEPEALLYQSEPPKVYLSHWQAIKPYSRGNPNENEGKTLLYPLPPQGPLTFDFGAEMFSLGIFSSEWLRKHQLEYAFRLSPQSNSWYTFDNRQPLRFQGMAPGDYRLEIKARFAQGEWGPVTGLPILIKPPFYRSSWFYTSMVVLAALLGYLLHRYRLQKQVEIERLRTHIAADLHDEMGTQLTRISLYAELASRQNNPAQLAKISSLSKEVIQTLSDVVWSVDSRKDSLIELVEKITDLARALCEEKGMQFQSNLQIPEKDQKLPFLVRQHTYLILKEAIHNSIKYSNGTRMQFAFEIKDQLACFELLDNGVGFDPAEAMKSGNGLFNMRNRAVKVKAQFDLKSGKEGTAVRLKVPFSPTSTWGYLEKPVP